MAAAMTGDGTCVRSFRIGRTMRPSEAAVPARPPARQGRSSAGKAVHDLWAWLTGTAYRPERHYMRGGRADAAGR
jgi:hypothetical protein